MQTVRSLRVTVLLTLLVLVAALIVGMQVLRPKPAGASIAGPAEHAVLNGEQAADLQFQVTPGAGVDAKRVTVTVDGRSVKAVRSGKNLVVRPEKLADGKHVLQVSVAASGPFGKAGSARRTFSVDSTAPVLELPETMTAPSLRGAFTVKGTSSGASAVTVNGSCGQDDRKGVHGRASLSPGDRRGRRDGQGGQRRARRGRRVGAPPRHARRSPHRPRLDRVLAA